MASFGVQVWGSVSINPTLLPVSGTSDILTFKVDGVAYSITLTIKTYINHKERLISDLVTEINSKLTTASCPVTAKIGGRVTHSGTISSSHFCVLVFEHNTQTGTHTIDTFGGNALPLIFGTITTYPAISY